MAILIYAESENGKYKKDSFEIASYAKLAADKLNTSVTAISINADNPNELGNYGVSKVLNVTSDNLKDFNAFLYADVIKQACEKKFNTHIAAMYYSSLGVSRNLCPAFGILM